MSDPGSVASGEVKSAWSNQLEIAVTTRRLARSALRTRRQQYYQLSQTDPRDAPARLHRAAHGGQRSVYGKELAKLVG